MNSFSISNCLHACVSNIFILENFSHWQLFPRIFFVSIYCAINSPINLHSTSSSIVNLIYFHIKSSSDNSTVKKMQNFLTFNIFSFSCFCVKNFSISLIFKRDITCEYIIISVCQLKIDVYLSINCLFDYY